MRLKQFQLGRIYGIPLIIDYSWPPIAILHIWAVSRFWMVAEVHNPLPLWQNLIFGTVITALFFASVLIHELAHSFVARTEGLSIQDIQLHIFGGWARLIGEPPTPMAELRIAVAGPVSSFLLAVFFWLWLFAAERLSGSSHLAQAAGAALFYLAAANLFLAMFNLLPGLPLDGGRVLRAILWQTRKDILSATRTTMKLGVWLAYLLMAYGLFLVLSAALNGGVWQQYMGAAWLLILGLFLKSAAENDYRYREQQYAGEQIRRNDAERWKISGTVGAVMQSPAVSVSPELSVAEFIDKILTAHRHTHFPVAREGRLHGVLSLERLRKEPQEKWERMTIAEVMSPINESLFITARASIEHAQRKMEMNSLGFLAVIDHDGLLIGHIYPNDLEKTA
ncbi:MAG TPA: site-2 protease family protein [Blastocatellia bacterium]|jgi:Zn-dependent protease/predicted transcriptional regulator|nr:site-2 protease family protein [Blastocatellia bacterium]